MSSIKFHSHNDPASQPSKEGPEKAYVNEMSTEKKTVLSIEKNEIDIDSH